MKKLIVLVLVLGCSTTPTGRRQLKLIGDSKMSELGDQSYAQLKSQTPMSKNDDQVRYVKCISEGILKAIGQNPNEWEINVFADDSANAFALPGKNIGVHTGILKIASTPAQLAAVIGHEIAHVELDHGNERLSQNMIIQGGLAATQIALSQKSSDQTKNQLIVAGLGIGVQFGLALPFSRYHEKEADLLGLNYMARAGFDPTQAAELWIKMGQSSGSTPEFLSTHPNSSSRVEYLKKEAPKYKNQYNAVLNKPKC